MPSHVVKEVLVITIGGGTPVLQVKKHDIHPYLGRLGLKVSRYLQQYPYPTRPVIGSSDRLSLLQGIGLFISKGPRIPMREKQHPFLLLREKGTNNIPQGQVLSVVMGNFRPLFLYLRPILG